MTDSDKSIVAYTSFAIEDPKIWTSLCLFHDTVFIFGPWASGAAESCIEGFYRYGYDNRLAKIRYFRNGPLKVLSEAGVIQSVDYDEYLSLFRKFPEDFMDFAATKWKTTPHPVDARSYAMALTYAQKLNIPVVSDLALIQYSGQNVVRLTKELSNILATSAIAQLSLPDVEAFDPESVLEARAALTDELAEYKASILKLTWLLNKPITDREHLEDLRNQVDLLVQTRIKGALISLENRMRQHEKTRVRRLLVSAAKVLFHVAKIFIPADLATRILAGSKSVFEIATEMKDTNPPEDQVATFLYQVKRRVNHRK